MTNVKKFHINGEDVVLNGVDISLEENSQSEQAASCKSVNEKFGIYTENPEYIRAYTDSDGRFLWGIKHDGSIEFTKGLPTSIKTYIDSIDKENDEEIERINQLIVDLQTDINALSDTYQYISNDLNVLTDTYHYISNSEWTYAIVDSEKRILIGIKPDGTCYIPKGISAEAEKRITILEDSLNNMTGTEWLLDFFNTYNDIEGRTEITLDGNEKIIAYRDSDGIYHEQMLMVEKNFSLSSNAVRSFQKSLNANINSMGTGDWSDYISEDGDKPLVLPIPRLAKVNFIVNYPLENLSKAGRDDAIQGINYDVPCEIEYYDNFGNHFKKPCLISAQGSSTMNDPQKNLSIDLFDSEVNGDALGIKFGNWVVQDSFHIKAFYKDITKSIQPVSFAIGEEMIRFLDCRGNKNHKNIISIDGIGGTGNKKTDFAGEALCHPDQFPVEVYRNGEFYGIMCWGIKKHRLNYTMDKDDYNTILVDSIGHFKWTKENPSWTMEIRNPKKLYCMDGSEYDGDNPKELIDSTSSLYDANNEYHVKTALTKSIILDVNNVCSKVNSASTIESKKEIFEKYFDLTNWICYNIFTELVYNQDGYVNNAQIGIYANPDGSDPKITVNIYDCDSCLGKSWSGVMWSLSTCRNVLIKENYHPMFMALQLYWDEHVEIYKKLRDNGVISEYNINNIIDNWFNRFGYASINKQLKRWPNPPSYRTPTNVNLEYWKQVMWYNYEQRPEEYDDNTTYNVGDCCIVTNESDTLSSCIYQCIKSCNGIAPSTSSNTNGCFDSPYRIKSWIKDRIKFLDYYYQYQ